MHSKGKYFLQSRSVTEGHPDKVADQISDAVLDTPPWAGSWRPCCLWSHGYHRYGCNRRRNNHQGLCGFAKVVRETIKNIGYSSSEMGFDWQTCSVISSIDHQSPISRRVFCAKKRRSGAQATRAWCLAMPAMKLLPLCQPRFTGRIFLSQQLAKSPQGWHGRHFPAWWKDPGILWIPGRKTRKN